MQHHLPSTGTKGVRWISSLIPRQERHELNYLCLLPCSPSLGLKLSGLAPQKLHVFFKAARRSTGTDTSDLFNFKSKLCLPSEVSANPVQSSVKAEQSPQTELKESTPQLGFGQLHKCTKWRQILPIYSICSSKNTQLNVTLLYT